MNQYRVMMYVLHSFNVNAKSEEDAYLAVDADLKAKKKYFIPFKVEDGEFKEITHEPNDIVQ